MIPARAESLSKERERKSVVVEMPQIQEVTGSQIPINSSRPSSNAKKFTNELIAMNIEAGEVNLLKEWQDQEWKNM